MFVAGLGLSRSASLAAVVSASSIEMQGYTSQPLATAAATAVEKRRTSTMTTTSPRAAAARTPSLPQSMRHNLPVSTSLSSCIVHSASPVLVGIVACFRRAPGRTMRVIACPSLIPRRSR